MECLSIIRISLMKLKLVFRNLLFVCAWLLFSVSLLAQNKNPITKFDLIGDLDTKIAPGEVRTFRVIVEAKGSGTLTVRIKEKDKSGNPVKPEFVDSLNESIKCNGSCELKTSFKISPSKSDCGNYKFERVAVFIDASDTTRWKIPVHFSVAQEITPEPPFSPDNYNEICWTPLINARTEDLISFPATEQPSQSTEQFSYIQSAQLDSCKVEERLKNGRRYGYYILTTLDGDAGIDTVFSDTVYSKQDNTPPKRIKIHDFAVDSETNVTLRWLNSSDEISYIDKYYIQRRELNSMNGEFQTIDSLSYFPVSSISPRNYYPIRVSQDSTEIYVDSTYVKSELLTMLSDMTMIKTALTDRWNESTNFLSFYLEAPSYIYIAIDKSIKPKPNWLRRKFTADLDGKGMKKDIITTKGELRLFKSEQIFPAGPVTLGGNFVKGTELDSGEPIMYLVFVQPVEKTFPYAVDGFVNYTNTLGKENDFKTFQYKVTAVDAAGNRADGFESPLIKLDLTGRCRPDWAKWYYDDIRDFGKDSTNTVSIKDPKADSDCMGFFDTDSVQFQSVRKYENLFSEYQPEEVNVLFFDSGWKALNELDEPFSYTFNLLPPGKDINFVNNIRYFYRVRAKDIHGNVTIWSDTVSAIQDAAPPGDISNMTVRNVISADGESGHVEVKWEPANDSGSGLKSYIICRKNSDSDNEFTIKADSSIYRDWFKNIGKNEIVSYRVGSIDSVGHVTNCDTSDWEKSIRALIGPHISVDSTQIIFCNSDSTGGTNKDNVEICWDDFDNEGVKGYVVNIQGPKDSTIIISDPDMTCKFCPLAFGDGFYSIRVRAFYFDEDTTTWSNKIRIRKKKQSPLSVDYLEAEQDTLPTGNINLKWTHPDVADVAKFQIYWWTENRSDSGAVDVTPTPCVPDTFCWSDTSAKAYQCMIYMVKTVDCFGNVSTDDLTDTNYSNRPPTIICDSTIVGADSITIKWQRPHPLHPLSLEFDTIIEVYQDTLNESHLYITPTRGPINGTTFSLPNPDDEHYYLFRVQEMNMSNLSQNCADSFMTTYSLPCSVAYEKKPLPVTDLKVQPLPVNPNPDSTKGNVFLAWKDYYDKHVEKFEVCWWEVGNSSNQSTCTTTPGDTLLIWGLDTSKVYACTVTAIDILDQRSVGNDTLEFDFKPYWSFTPKILSFDPDCFKDSVWVHWGWLNEKGEIAASTTFGAESVQIEISIHPDFSREKSSTDWIPATEYKHLFKKEQDYSFVNFANDELFAHIHGRDSLEHVSPWSNEYVNLQSDPGNYDELPPDQTACRIDSVRAPDRGDTNTVDVYLSWPPAEALCSGTRLYYLITNEPDTIIVDSTTYTDKGVNTDSLSFLTWKVLAEDSLGNLQAHGETCNFMFTMYPPKSSWLQTDTTIICWTSGFSNVPEIQIEYIIEVSNDTAGFGHDPEHGLSELLDPPSPDTCYTINNTWEPAIVWRIKSRVGDFESAWSKIFRDTLTNNLTSVLTSESNFVPSEFALLQNYPNPFNPSTVIEYDIPNSVLNSILVRLEIFNVMGQKVRTLVNEKKRPGRHSVLWNGRDDFGRQSSSGIFYYRIQAGDFVKICKMIFLK